MSNRFYAAVEGVGVFFSDNDGATWTNVTTGTIGQVAGADTAGNMRIAARGDIVYVGVVNDWCTQRHIPLVRQRSQLDGHGCTVD